MRADMARVIVERPRRGGIDRPGRAAAFDDAPYLQGMRRPYRYCRGKELNENLAPLRRFLERQVGRPWNKVYSEIARHLRGGNTVQQHVRDHLEDFVAVKPRRINGTFFRDTRLPTRRFVRLWHQPFYVDEKEES